MRISVSNIAWDPAEDQQIARVLRGHGVSAIDVAPAKYFPDPFRAGDADIRRVREWWSARDISIYGMQALLHGTQGLNLFGAPEVRRRMHEHLAEVCRIGEALGATRLAFGSPRNRDRGQLSDDEVHAISTEFFQRLGDTAARHGLVICLEPNPPHYGGNFMTDSAGTVAVVRAVGHDHVRMLLDTGAMTLNGEAASAVIPALAALVGHIHLSEPDLVPLGDGATDHDEFSAWLPRLLPGHTVTVEMLATVGEAHERPIDRALQLACRRYS